MHLSVFKTRTNKKQIFYVGICVLHLEKQNIRPCCNINQNLKWNFWNRTLLLRLVFADRSQLFQYDSVVIKVFHPIKYWKWRIPQAPKTSNLNFLFSGFGYLPRGAYTVRIYSIFLLIFNKKLVYWNISWYNTECYREIIVLMPPSLWFKTKIEMIGF